MLIGTNNSDGTGISMLFMVSIINNVYTFYTGTHQLGSGFTNSSLSASTPYLWGTISYHLAPN